MGSMTSFNRAPDIMVTAQLEGDTYALRVLAVHQSPNDNMTRVKVELPETKAKAPEPAEVTAAYLKGRLDGAGALLGFDSEGIRKLLVSLADSDTIPHRALGLSPLDNGELELTGGDLVISMADVVAPNITKYR